MVNLIKREKNDTRVILLLHLTRINLPINTLLCKFHEHNVCNTIVKPSLISLSYPFGTMDFRNLSYIKSHQLWWKNDMRVIPGPQLGRRTQVILLHTSNILSQKAEAKEAENLFERMTGVSFFQYNVMIKATYAS